MISRHKDTDNSTALSARERFMIASSPAQRVFGFMYYVKAALAGGICAGVTHGAVTPVDVVKTRMQLDPHTYNRGLIGGFKQIIEAEGPKGLLTGLGPTLVGYFIQGWFKFGGVEFFKVQFTKKLGDDVAWENKTAIYLASSAMAEFIADIFLSPLEATRIRLVSQPSFANGLVPAATRLFNEEGLVRGFYSGFGPILFKQIPYTMAKFAVQGETADAMCAAMGMTQADLTGSLKLSVAMASGVVAGVVAAVVSHPADTLLSKVNKAGAGGTGPVATRLMRIAKDIGFVKLATVGLGSRCVMVGALTAGQFLLFDVVMDLVGAEKFHFHPPDTTTTTK